MPELSQDAIRELRQSLPLLKRLVEEFAQALSIYHDDIARLQGASDRVRALTPTDQFEAWVGGSITFGSSEENEILVLEILNDETTATITYSSPMELVNHFHRYAQNLYLYVQGILRNEELEERLNHLTQENASQKEQLAELRKRELAYLSIIKEAQATTSYSVPPENVYSVSVSYQTERTLLVGNLHYLREQAAMYGPLETPLHIRNNIEAHEKLINEIDAHIAHFKASKTDWI